MFGKLYRLLLTVVLVATSVIAAGGAFADQAGGKFDGTWRVKVSGGTGSNCQSGMTRNAKITNDAFELLWNTSNNTYLKGTVTEGGELSLSGGSSGTVKYDGNKFVGSVSNRYCSYDLEIQRR